MSGGPSPLGLRHPVFDGPSVTDLSFTVATHLGDLRFELAEGVEINPAGVANLIDSVASSTGYVNKINQAPAREATDQ